MSGNQRIKVALLIAIVAAVPGHAAQETTGDYTGLRTATGVKVDFAELIPLDLFVGPWRVMENHFNARGEVIATVRGNEEISWVLDRRAIRRIYTTSTESSVFRAIGMLTWNSVEKMYHAVWFDNRAKTGPVTMKGEWFPKSKTMEFAVETRGEDGSEIRYKVVERFLDAERRVATTFLTTGGTVVKRMEVEYRRVTPCPKGVRAILDPDIVGITK